MSLRRRTNALSSLWGSSGRPSIGDVVWFEYNGFYGWWPGIILAHVGSSLVKVQELPTDNCLPTSKTLDKIRPFDLGYHHDSLVAEQRAAKTDEEAFETALAEGLRRYDALKDKDTKQSKKDTSMSKESNSKKKQKKKRSAAAEAAAAVDGCHGTSVVTDKISHAKKKIKRHDHEKKHCDDVDNDDDPCQLKKTIMQVQEDMTANDIREAMAGDESDNDIFVDWRCSSQEVEPIHAEISEMEAIFLQSYPVGSCVYYRHQHMWHPAIIVDCGGKKKSKSQRILAIIKFFNTNELTKITTKNMKYIIPFSSKTIQQVRDLFAEEGSKYFSENLMNIKRKELHRLLEIATEYVQLKALGKDTSLYMKTTTPPPPPHAEVVSPSEDPSSSEDLFPSGERRVVVEETVTTTIVTRTETVDNIVDLDSSDENGEDNDNTSYALEHSSPKSSAFQAARKALKSIPDFKSAVKVALSHTLEILKHQDTLAESSINSSVRRTIQRERDALNAVKGNRRNRMDLMQTLMHIGPFSDKDVELTGKIVGNECIHESNRTFILSRTNCNTSLSVSEAMPHITPYIYNVVLPETLRYLLANASGIVDMDTLEVLMNE